MTGPADGGHAISPVADKFVGDGADVIGEDLGG